MSHPTMGAWIEIWVILVYVNMMFKSHPTMGAWIEIFHHIRTCSNNPWSHPTMGAWIEITILFQRMKERKGRTPRWVRGLK